MNRSFLLLAITLFLLSGCGEGENTRKNRFLLKGNAALEENNEEQAIKYFRETIRIDSCFADAYNNIGTVLFRQQKFEEALDSYNHSIACNPGVLNSYFNRSYTLYELGKTQEAYVDVEKVLIDRPDTIPALFLKGLILSKARHYDRAQEVFLKALSHDSLNSELLVNLGIVFFYQKKYSQSTSCLEKAISINPKEANAYNVRSQVEAANNNLDAALLSINKALEIKPGNAFYRNNRGYIHLLKNEFVLALEDIDYSIVTDPYNAWAYRNKGIYFLKKNDAASAVRLLEQAVLLDANVEHGYLYLSEAYLKTGDKPKACDAWKEALKRGEDEKSDLINQCK